MRFGEWIQIGISPRLQDNAPNEDPTPNSDPIEALTETAADATEAATEFLGWIGSGELEALIALALVVALT
ncbi:MAG: hypothetical protein NXH88_01325, partial [Hyphomonas sp.]|nr:hypothetical protein [Hyphomonas sp.]